jgi:hypothetical protein
MDPITIATLATTVLAPALKYLLKIGEKGSETFAEEASADLGKEAWEKAKTLWSRLGGKVANKPAALEAAADVSQNPADPAAKGALELQIRKILAEDPALMKEIDQTMARLKISVETLEDSTLTGIKAKEIGKGAKVEADIAVKQAKKSTITGLDLDRIG